MSVTQSFPNITVPQWEKIKAVLQEKTGIAITTDSGTQRFDKGLLHYDVTWTYMAAELSITAEPDGWISRQSSAEVQQAIRQGVEKITLEG